MAKKSYDLVAIVSIIVGVIILIAPQILAWAIGLYLILFGILKIIDKR